jgi:hypothetical protein
LPISATDTITIAFQHTKRQLFQPFRFGQWARLAIVGLLAGEMGSGSRFHFPSNLPHRPGPSQHFLDMGLPPIDPALYAVLIAIVIVAALVFGIVFLYVNSVMRFILFDSVLATECHIREGWARRQFPGWRYFLWQIAYVLAVFAGVVILLGIPAALAFGMGWFTAPREHLVGLVLGGIVLFFVMLIFVIAAAVIHVLTKDFVVPQMALEGVGVIEGWRRLWPMIQAEKGGYAGYVGWKILLAIVAGVVLTVVSLIVGVLVAIPTLLLAIVAVLTGKGAGLTWNVYTITVAVVVGCILLAAFFYLLALIAVPVMVFFPAYSIYFFASRYQPLSQILYPPPPPAWSPGGPPAEPVPAG